MIKTRSDFYANQRIAVLIQSSGAHLLTFADFSNFVSRDRIMVLKVIEVPCPVLLQYK